MVLATTDLANPTLTCVWLGKRVPETWMWFTAHGQGARQCNSNTTTVVCNPRIL